MGNINPDNKKYPRMRLAVKYRKLGRAGLIVSELGVGCMDFGAVTQEKDTSMLPSRFQRLVKPNLTNVSAAMALTCYTGY